jgi:hypothetical protein
MLFDHSRGFFMMIYNFIFVNTIVWNLFHGFSDVDDQVLWAEVCSRLLSIEKKVLPGSKKLYSGPER